MSTNERMSDEQIDWYIAEGQKHPHDGVSLQVAVQLRTDLAAARKKNRELNRREQQAVAAYRSAEKAIENAKQGDGFRWASGNLGRAFLAFDNAELRKQLAAANAIIERLPKTADGVHVIPSLTRVYTTDSLGQVFGGTVGWRGDTSEWWLMCHDTVMQHIDECYSTREAAEAAREAKP